MRGEGTGHGRLTRGFRHATTHLRVRHHGNASSECLPAGPLGRLHLAASFGGSSLSCVLCRRGSRLLLRSESLVRLVVAAAAAKGKPDRGRAGHVTLLVRVRLRECLFVGSGVRPRAGVNDSCNDERVGARCGTVAHSQPRIRSVLCTTAICMPRFDSWRLIFIVYLMDWVH